MSIEIANSQSKVGVGQPACGNCVFFLRTQDLQNPGGGMCRRFPPTVQAFLIGQGKGGLIKAEAVVMQKFTHFPELRPEGWCGEFKFSATALNDMRREELRIQEEGQEDIRKMLASDD